MEHAGGAVHLTLSDGSVLTADHVVFATGYRADITRASRTWRTSSTASPSPRGSPIFRPASRHRCTGLAIIGFAATRDFGPFFGFTKGCPSAARIAVDEMMR